ncbi:Nucleolar protein 12 [Pseudocercospora fuligena]|uniref:Nucleolar protein 12 n=1 Tax=Pseudocercospora fuligena TaxID=685502 RepID=A0A8H6R9G0_9PEZI|nr:Nucleolar protein 12 [Pseudocercospora fuligena]
MAKSKEKSDKSKSEKREKRSKNAEKVEAEEKQFSLLADDKTVNTNLASLFAVKQPPVKSKPPPVVPRPVAKEESDAEEGEEGEEGEENDAELSELDEDVESDADVDMKDDEEVASEEEGAVEAAKPQRKRKRKNAGDELEDAYMGRLAREEEKEAGRLAAERAAKRRKQREDEGDEDGSDADGQDDVEEQAADEDDDDDDDDSAMSPPPKHETEVAADEELSKANRTVFLGNVSTAAISSKSSRKALLNHLASFFEKLPPSKDGTKHKVESIRFRSTPYATAIPKKAAFAKKELMDATTKSTNAYVVYSTEKLAREAVQHLNGTIILGRHLRVDSVAHPAKIDIRRCIFVGNLGFVDDESNIQDANEEEGREKRKRGKEPADIEEGLWRTFSKSGKVESVRVIRDSTTRVGKGIAYVQFEDENAVEQALLLNEKKFPPMLPRKLRVSRAKAPKKNAKPGTGRPSARPSAGTGYQRKLTGAEASQMGRTGKLLGRAAAAKVRKGGDGGKENRSGTGDKPQFGNGIKRPEDFIKKSPMIFEGHRASSKQGKSGLKLGGKGGGKKKTKVTKRSTSFKSKKKA